MILYLYTLDLTIAKQIEEGKQKEIPELRLEDSEKKASKTKNPRIPTKIKFRVPANHRAGIFFKLFRTTNNW